MKPYLIALTLLFSSSQIATAQQKESFYVYDNDWKPTSIENAKILLSLVKKSDTCWQFDYYYFNGPMIKSEQFRDSEGDVQHGNTRYYLPNGQIDSTAYYVNGKKHGTFSKFKQGTDSLIWQTIYQYENDLLVATNDPMARRDTTATLGEEIESEYPGGLKRWGEFLNKNLRYPDRAIKGNFQGTVRVAFIVDTQGKVNEPFITKSVEYSLDRESIRMIQLSGKWKPASQAGKLVKSYKLQPITYRLQ